MAGQRTIIALVLVPGWRLLVGNKHTVRGDYVNDDSVVELCVIVQHLLARPTQSGEAAK